MNSLFAERFVQFTLLVAAVVHLTPVSGLAGSETLQRLYGIVTPDANALLLLRHRALLFGLVAIPLLIAIPQPAWRLPAMTGALLSIASFLLLSALETPSSPELRRVVQIDLVVLVVLVPALVLSLRHPGAALG